MIALHPYKAYAADMRIGMIVIAMIALAGCAKSAAEQAEEQYQIVSKSGELGKSDKCAAAGRAKDAWLAEGNSKKYEEWQLTEYADCAAASRRY